MSKRSCIPIPGISKKLKTGPLLSKEEKSDDEMFEKTDFIRFPSETEIQLENIRSISKTLYEPPIIFVHQLLKPDEIDYNNTILSEIADLESSKVIKSFSLGRNLPKAVIFTSDLNEYLKKFKPNPRVKRFIEDILPNFTQTFLFESDLETYKINELIKFGLLLKKSNKSYTFAIPGINKFLNEFILSRNKVITIIKRSKNKKVKSEVLKAKIAQMPLMRYDYILPDLIGAEIVSYDKTEDIFKIN